MTGGTGSIGSVIVKELLKYDPAAIRIFSRDEYKQVSLQHELRNEKLRFLIGDIRDKQRVLRAFEDVDIVFHAAAMKHVPLCEYNPFEAIQTNVLGTQNVVDAAIENNAEALISISTDKVIAPANVMGSTKLLAERIVSSGYLLKGNSRRTRFAVVRFGNVLYSRGSVLELWKKQLLQNNTIALTDPEMTRFFMSIPQAVNLCFKALKYCRRNETFILKMPALKMFDLAKVFIEKYGRADSEIKIIGRRPGEKKHEELLAENEAEKAYETEDMFIIRGNIPDFVTEIASVKFNLSPTERKHYRSDAMDLLDKEKIKDLI